jgi:hypothetical protein
VGTPCGFPGVYEVVGTPIAGLKSAPSAAPMGEIPARMSEIEVKPPDKPAARAAAAGDCGAIWPKSPGIPLGVLGSGAVGFPGPCAGPCEPGSPNPG